jgi:pilus assembly protein CpaF
MLKITVLEKGGSERELYFDENEITIGRLQSNMVVLSKANVSKKHALITVENTKVFIKDLGSTNGTYVNGRRIVHQRELSPEDRVYIGDFTLRISIISGKAESVVEPPPVPEETEDSRRATIAMTALKEEAPARVKAKEAQEGKKIEEPEAIPVDIEVEVAPQEEPAQAVPSAGQEKPPMQPQEQVQEPPLVQAKEPASSPPVELAQEKDEPAQASRQEGSGVERSPYIFGYHGEKTGGPTNRYFACLREVSKFAQEEVFADVPGNKSDFSEQEWNDLSDKVFRLVERLRREKVISSDIDPYTLTQDLLFEFTGLGPLEEILADKAIRRVTINGLDSIFVTQGFTTRKLDKGFVSAETLQRVLQKLSALSNLSSEDASKPIVDGHLPDGTTMTLLKPPFLTEGISIVLTRPVGSRLTAKDLVDAGVIGKSEMGTLEQAVLNHKQVFVCGGPHTGKQVFLNALVQCLPEDERLVIVEHGRELDIDRGDVVFVSKDGMKLVEHPGTCVISRLQAGTVVIPEVEPEDAKLLVALALSGHRGLIACLNATSVRNCKEQLALMISFMFPSVATSAVSSLVEQLVDIVVVLERETDGKPRVADIGFLKSDQPEKNTMD